MCRVNTGIWIGLTCANWNSIFLKTFLYAEIWNKKFHSTRERHIYENYETEWKKANMQRLCAVALQTKPVTRDCHFWKTVFSGL